MYRLRSTGEIRSQDEIRQAHPGTSFPSVWTPQLVNNLGLDPILDTPAPAVTRYQTARQDGIQQDAAGNWVWKWVVVDMDPEQKAAADATQAAAVRSTRNQKLTASDWTQLADTPGQTRAAYVQYRQDLRNLPQQPGFPWDVNWPQEPTT